MLESAKPEVKGYIPPQGPLGKLIARKVAADGSRRVKKKHPVQVHKPSPKPVSKINGTAATPPKTVHGDINSDFVLTTETIFEGGNDEDVLALEEVSEVDNSYDYTDDATESYALATESAPIIFSALFSEEYDALSNNDVTDMGQAPSRIPTKYPNVVAPNLEANTYAPTVIVSNFTVATDATDGTVGYKASAYLDTGFSLDGYDIIITQVTPA